MRTPEMSDAAPRPIDPRALLSRPRVRASAVLTALAALIATVLVSTPAAAVNRVAIVQAGSTISALEVTGDGAYVYASGGWWGEDNHEIAVIRAWDRAVVERFEIDFNVTDLELDGSGRLYVARYESGGWGGVSYHDSFDGTQLGMIATGDATTGIELSDDGDSLYIANSGARTVWRVDTESFARTGDVSIGSSPNSMTLSPDGSLLFVIADTGLVVIDEETFQIIHRDASFDYRSEVAFDATGAWAYVADPEAGSLTVIDTSDGSVVQTIPVSGGPSAVQIAPRGDVAYVLTPQNRTMSVVRLDTGSVVQTVRVSNATFPNPVVIALDPTGEEAYVGDIATGEVSVHELLTGPLAPTSTALSATETSLTLSWEPPVYDGGSDVTGYVVSYRPAGSSSFNAVELGPDARSYTLEDLTPGEAMQFRVRAVNAHGQGAESGLLSGAASVPPGAPTELEASPGDGQVELTWVNAADDGGSAVTGYRVEYRTEGGDWQVGSTTPTGNSPRRIVLGLTNGAAYEFRVSSINVAGAGAPSEPISATPFVIPAAPTAVAAQAGDSSTWVTWEAPENPIVESFTVTVREGGAVVAEHSIAPHLRGATIGALENGTAYDVTVTAVTPYGDSAASSAAAVTPVKTARPNAMARILVEGFPRMLGFTTSPDGEQLLLPHYYDDELYVVDIDSGTVAERLTTHPESRAGSEPATAIASPDGRTVYTLDFNGTSVTHLDLATGELLARADLRGLPWSGALSPDGSQLWVANTVDVGIQVLDAVTLELIAEGPAPASPAGVAISPDSGRAYVGSNASGVTSVAVYDAETFALVEELEVAGSPKGLEVTPDGSRLVVISGSGSVLTIIDLQGSAEPVVIPLGGAPEDVALSRDGAVAYVSLLSDGGETVVVDLEAAQVVDRIPTPGTPRALHVSSVTGAVYVSLEDQGVAELVDATVPAAPTGLSATRGDGEVSLAWSAPANDGGGAILDYVVEYADSTEQWQVLSRSRSSVTSATVTGLINGELHGFRVRAVNGAGTGAVSEVATATPAAVPGVVTELEARPSDGGVTVEWGAPSSDGGEPITGYEVELRQAGMTTVLGSSSGTDRSAVFAGLDNGAAYEISVIAVNAVGGSAPATVGAIPRTVPDAPTGLSVTRGDEQLALSWTAPSEDGGDAVVDYLLEIREDGGTWEPVDDGESTATSATVSGLTNGTTYDVRVSAVNAAGAGAASGVATAVPATTPGAVGSVVASPGDGEVVLTWEAPAVDGGESVTGYEVQYRAEGGTWSSPVSRASTTGTLVGLTNGESYAFRVRAVNAVGTGPVAEVSATPRTVPGAPAGLAAVGGDEEIVLTWAAPADDGGASIADYVIEFREVGGTWETFDDGESPGTSATVTGLVNGTEYDVRVSAVNVAGEGLPMVGSATPEALPGAPDALAVDEGDRVLVVSWDAPMDDGGRAVSHYVVEHRVQGGDWQAVEVPAADGTSHELEGLVNGTAYEVRVSARNSVGIGPAAIAAAVAPRTVPEAPTAVAVTAGSDRVHVSWTPPADGGSAITGYLVEYRELGGAWVPFTPGGGSGGGGIVSAPLALAAVSSPEVTILGLSSETTYEVRVSALNEAGRSDASQAARVTTLAAPGGLPATGPDAAFALAALLALAAAAVGLVMRRRASGVSG